jgi:hypothetical protein
MADWNKMKFDFLDHINTNQINTFNDFHNSLKSLKTNIKGNYFEYFCKLYFILDLYCKNNYKNFYLYTEIPSNIKIKQMLKNTKKHKFTM